MPREVDRVTAVVAEGFEGLAAGHDHRRLDQREDAGEERLRVRVHHVCEPVVVGEGFLRRRGRLRPHALEEALLVGLGEVQHIERLAQAQAASASFASV